MRLTTNINNVGDLNFGKIAGPFIFYPLFQIVVT